jgi:hypothetical protein
VKWDDQILRFVQDPETKIAVAKFAVLASIEIFGLLRTENLPIAK